MLLSILIPTFNRVDDLIFNLNLLEKIILNNNLNDYILLMVSNNCSTDTTKEKLEEFKQQTALNTIFYNQDSNIGLENNALFLCEKASSEFIMYLGDDDYLESDYLASVVKIIKDDNSISCVIPSWIGISSDKLKIKGCCRDLKIKSRLYDKGFYSCYKNSFRGHQLSGLTFKRLNLLDEYKKRKVHNIYPFIFFVAYCSLKGKLYLLTDFPVKVTQPGQLNKDWGYGHDGLLNEIFDNFKKIDVNIIKISCLQFKVLKEQPFRYLMYFSNGSFYSYIKAVFCIVKSPNVTYIVKLVFPLYSLFKLFKHIIRRWLKR